VDGWRRCKSGRAPYILACLSARCAAGVSDIFMSEQSSTQQHELVFR